MMIPASINTLFRRSGLCAISLAGLLAPASAESNIEHLLPPNAVGAFIIEDAAALLAAWEQSPFNKLMGDESIKRYLAPSLDREEGAPWDEMMKKTTGHTLWENLALYKGPVLVALIGPDQGEGAAYFEHAPGVLLVGQIGDDPAAFKAYAAKDLVNTEKESGADFEEKTEDYLGETLNLRRRTTDEGETEDAEGWAIVGNTAVIAWPQDLLRTTVSGLKNPPGEAALPADLKAHQLRAGSSDITAFVNLSLLEPSWREWAAKNLKETLEKNPAGITLDGLLKALAPENLSSVAVSIDLAASETHLDISIGKKGDSGILSLFAYTNGELRKPPFVPAAAMHAGVARFDLGVFYDRIFDIAKALSPMFAGMIEGHLAGIESQIGVNFRQNLIGGLSSDLAFFEDLRTDGHKQGGSESIPQTEMLYAVALKNVQGVENALGSIRTFLGHGMAAFEEREFLGAKVFTFKLPATPKTPTAADAADDDGSEPQPAMLPIEISHTISGGYLLVGLGSQRPIERALSALNTPAETLWDKPVVRSTLEAAAQSMASFEYYDYSGLIHLLLKGLNQAQAAQPEEERVVNPDASPDAEVFSRYLGVTMSLMRVEPNALHTRTTLLGAEK